MQLHLYCVITHLFIVYMLLMNNEWSINILSFTVVSSKLIEVVVQWTKLY